ncbi:hypothetical protein HYT52_01540 [Candidatus Woesearchaeota archaeon]|nr:hypothetical protein [Candidatus Woesearchaeota archaeon]
MNIHQLSGTEQEEIEVLLRGVYIRRVLGIIQPVLIDYLTTRDIKAEDTVLVAGETLEEAVGVLRYRERSAGSIETRRGIRLNCHPDEIVLDILEIESFQPGVGSELLTTLKQRDHRIYAESLSRPRRFFEKHGFVVAGYLSESISLMVRNP